MSRRLAAAAVIVALFITATEAFAQPSAYPPGPAPAPLYGPEPTAPPAEISYGRDIAKADAVAAGLLGAAFISGIVCFAEAFGEGGDDSPPSCVLAAGSFIGSAGVYALGSPIIHISKGQPGKAVLALGARVGLPLLGYHLGKMGDSDSATGYGVLAGFGGALVLDWFVLARHEAPPTGPRPYVAPAANGNGMSAGIGGAF